MISKQPIGKWAISHPSVTGSGVAGATTVTMSGNVRGKVNVSLTITASLDSISATNVIVTPTDSAGGTFSPLSQTIVAGNLSTTFTYTPAVPGILSITGPNDSALATPAFSFKSDPLAFYLSATGSDAANGFTTGTPWQTWAAAVTWGIVRGATYYFNGGDSFTQAITFNDGVSGINVSDKITLTSYGTGKAIISNSNKTTNPITINCCGGITINNLEISGAGSTPTLSSQNLVNILRNTGSQIYNIEVSYCKMHDAWMGVRTDKLTSTTEQKLDGLIIEHNEAYSLWRRFVSITADITTTAVDNTWNSNVKIRYNHIYNLDNTEGTPGPAGIVVSFSNSPEISYNLIHDIGGVSTVTENAIYTWGNTSSPWIHHNEIYNIVRNTGGDAGGPNFDSGTTNGICEFNYVHDCGGAGLVAYAFQVIDKPAYVPNWSNNTYRFNVIQNCGGSVWGVFTALGDTVLGIKCYNNTFIVRSTANAAVQYGVSGFPGTNISGDFYNNIFYIHGTAKPIDMPSGSGLAANNHFGNNTYFMADAGAVSINWFGTTYNSVAAWGQDAGASIVDPLMSSPDTVTVFNDTSLIGTLAGIKLTASSPIKDSGLNLSAAPYNYTGITVDYAGNTFPSGTGWAVGAVDLAITSITITDLFSGNDSSLTTLVSFTLPDSGTSSDVASNQVTLTVTETISSLDNISASIAAAITDTLIGIESLAASANLSITDTAFSSETLSLITTAVINVLETASGIDSVQSIQVSSVLSDNSVGTDAINISVSCIANDTASAVDTVSTIQSILIALTDTGAVSDSLSIAVNLTAIDSIHGLESTSINSVFSLSDTASTTETVVATNQAAQVRTVRFTLSARPTTFVLPLRGDLV